MISVEAGKLNIPSTGHSDASGSFADRAVLRVGSASAHFGLGAVGGSLLDGSVLFERCEMGWNVGDGRQSGRGRGGGHSHRRNHSSWGSQSRTWWGSSDYCGSSGEMGE